VSAFQIPGRPYDCYALGAYAYSLRFTFPFDLLPFHGKQRYDEPQVHVQ